jgi:hypothetical protein
MNTPSNDTHALPRWLWPWEDFWFAPADPTPLALIRISCGMIVVYTLFVYSFKLQEYEGEFGWHDLREQRERIKERPVYFAPLNWDRAGQLPLPKDEFQKEYVREYRRKWGSEPPPPYPTSPEQAKFLDDFRGYFGVDLRKNGLEPSDDLEKREYAKLYTATSYKHEPPPAYPKDAEEAKAIQEYVDRFGVDPRMLYDRGMPLFSIWFHVTEPTAMAVIHGLIVFVAFLFTIGFCTRFTSALLWFSSLCYIHRNPTVLFGVDTMMTILLFYLMIGPCGATYSIDNLIRKWWVKAKPGVVHWWYGLLRRPVPANILPADPVPDVAKASIAANVAIRLLQIHVCIVYLYAGVSKLQGQSWWTGTAVWMTMGNYEFAPMQFEAYLQFIRWLGKNQLVYDAFMTASCLFTLVFEIGYAFLIWRPRLRWMFLAAAIMLHGGIGLFLGLKTFSLMMLVMNMAFLRKEEVVWLLSVPGNLFASQPKPAAAPNVAAVPVKG